MTSKTSHKKQPKKRPASVGRKKAVLRGVEDLDSRVTIVKEVASTGSFIVKGLFVVGIVFGGGYLLINGFRNRFKPMPENSNWPVSNITKADAEARADQIDGAIGLLSGNFETIQNAFSHPSGLNGNAFVRIYNAFGNRKSTLLGSEMNLKEWLDDQLSDFQREQIRTITYGII